MAFTAAYGTLLSKGNGASPEVFTPVAQIQDLTGPAQKVDTIDTTTHDGGNGYKAFIGGLKEGGDIKVPILFDPANATHTGLIATLNAGLVVNWKITLPTSPAVNWTFAGLVTDLSHSYKMNGALMSDLTIKVSAKPTLA